MGNSLQTLDLGVNVGGCLVAPLHGIFQPGKRAIRNMIVIRGKM